MFREPISYREEALRVRLGHELNLIGGANAEIARTRRHVVLLAMADLEEAAREAKSMARWPMHLVVVGILLNFALLLAATVIPDQSISPSCSVTLILASAGPYVIGVAALWWIASYKFDSVVSQFDRTKEANGQLDG